MRSVFSFSAVCAACRSDKIFFSSWSKKPRVNQMAHIAFFYAGGTAYHAFSPVKRMLFLFIT